MIGNMTIKATLSAWWLHDLLCTTMHMACTCGVCHVCLFSLSSLCPWRWNYTVPAKICPSVLPSVLCYLHFKSHCKVSFIKLLLFTGTKLLKTNSYENIYFFFHFTIISDLSVKIHDVNKVQKHFYLCKAKEIYHIIQGI